MKSLVKLINRLKEWWENLTNPVMNLKRIDCPKGYVIYHKDGDKYNNRKKNLEVISRAEMLKRNQQKNREKGK